MNIVTEEQIKEIDEFIKDREFWKSDTGTTVKETFIALVTYGMDSKTAMNNISVLINAMSEEYGD